MTLVETIAEEVFRTIERERRINKDDIILAVHRAMASHDKPAHAYREPIRRELDDQLNAALAKLNAESIALIRWPATDYLT